MTFATYMRYEALRTLRNRRFMILALGFPLVIYFLIATPNRHEQDIGGTGISAPLYLMVGLVTFGTMNAMLGSGARIAAERTAGWNRQLRITPLSPRTYFRTKVLTGYMLAAMTMLLLYAAGSVLGVQLSAGEWLQMTVLLLVGLIPFAALGILFGHLLTPDSIGPAIGGLTAALSILGGVWFPVTGNGVLHDIALALPSYWLVQAAHVGIGGQRLGRHRLGGARRVDRRRRVSRTPRVRARHEADVATIGSTMADHDDRSIEEQLEEIGAQLDWVRGYL